MKIAIFQKISVFVAGKKLYYLWFTGKTSEPFYIYFLTHSFLQNCSFIYFNSNSSLLLAQVQSRLEIKTRERFFYFPMQRNALSAYHCSKNQYFEILRVFLALKTAKISCSPEKIKEKKFN